MRAEGFATWFTGYAADYSALLERGSVAAEYARRARATFKETSLDGPFRGSADDYARASIIFSALVERRGIRGLLHLYEGMTVNKLDLLPALEARIGWDEAKVRAEMERLLPQ
jgi:hypothetical protein